MLIRTELGKGDLTRYFEGPTPCRDTSGKQLGMVLSVDFDGEHTHGIVDTGEDLAAKLPRGTCQ